MKKSIYKILLFLVCLSLAVTIFGIGTFADSIPEKEATREEFFSAEEETVDDNIFTELYRSLCENGDKIFSLFSFIGTLIIAILYKRGLMPGLKNALTSFKEALNEIKSESVSVKNNTKEYGEHLNAIRDEIKLAALEAEKLSERITDENAARDRLITSAILKEQKELLSDIFMSSSLPEFKKEAVGNRISKMKELIKNEEIKAE